jgi:hypothetical protein
MISKLKIDRFARIIILISLIFILRLYTTDEKNNLYRNKGYLNLNKDQIGSFWFKIFEDFCFS